MKGVGLWESRLRDFHMSTPQAHQRPDPALNSRPRKTLGWKTPAEALDDYLRLIRE